MLKLDTHVLLYALAGELTRREATLLARGDVPDYKQLYGDLELDVGGEGLCCFY